MRVDIDPRKLVDRLPAAVALWSDAGSAATALAAALPDADSKRRAQSAETVTRLRTQADSNLSELQKKHMRIGAILKQTLPQETYVVADMTQLAYTFRGALGFEQPGRFLHPKGYGTLGYALPAAIGAKIAEPDCPALIVMGDGGLMFTLGENGYRGRRRIPT